MSNVCAHICASHTNHACVCVSAHDCASHMGSACARVCVIDASQFEKIDRTLKSQWLKKTTELEELIDVVQFKVTGGEPELTKLLADMRSNLLKLTSPTPIQGEPGSDPQLSFKTRLSAFQAEMSAWLIAMAKKQDVHF